MQKQSLPGAPASGPCPSRAPHARRTPPATCTSRAPPTPRPLRLKGTNGYGYTS